MIFRYPGGKSKKSIREWILLNAPKTVKEYREPMVGGGGVFFHVNPGLRRWVNDIHPGLMAVYQELRDDPVEFVEACRRIPANTASVLEAFPAFKDSPLADSALRYFFLNRVTFGGRVNYDIPSRQFCSNPEGWNVVFTDKMEKAAEVMRGVEITCGDYRPLLERPGEDVWIYVDPPYVKNTDLAASSQLYQYSFTNRDHFELSEAIKSCPHKVSLSYDDCSLVRGLYRDFRILENSWTYCGTGQSEKSLGKELLILNY